RWIWSARRRASAAATCTASRPPRTNTARIALRPISAATWCRAASGSTWWARFSIRAAACSARAAPRRSARSRISSSTSARWARADAHTVFPRQLEAHGDREARAQRQRALDQGTRVRRDADDRAALAGRGPQRAQAAELQVGAVLAYFSA